jgi:hypothetical protein
MGDGQKVTGASDCWRDSEIVVRQVLYLREVQDEKPDTPESSTQATDFLQPTFFTFTLIPIARHTRDSHAVVDFLIAVPAGQPDLLKRKAPHDRHQDDLAHHREVLPDTVSWSVLKGP